MPTPTRWSRSDIRAARSALDGWLVLNTGATAGPAEREALEESIPPVDKARCAASYLDHHACIRDEQAEEVGRAWGHFQEYPEVYGDMTPAIVQRFKEAVGREAARRRWALAGRLRAEGMPPGGRGSSRS